MVTTTDDVLSLWDEVWRTKAPSEMVTIPADKLWAALAMIDALSAVQSEPITLQPLPRNWLES